VPSSAVHLRPIVRICGITKFENNYFES